MSNLMNEVARHLSNDVIMQLTRQIGAQDPNQVQKAAHGAAELLLNAISKNAGHQERGGGLFGAIERDHDGGILGNLLGVLQGQGQPQNPKTMNGSGIITHLLGNKQLEAAKILGDVSGLDFFKSGVLMQLLAPIVMGVVGQKRKSSGLDLGGLASVLLGGGNNQQASQSPAGGLFKKLIDRDGDGNIADDLLSMGMKFLKK